MNRLRILRKNRRLTIKEVADEIGFSETRLHQYETEKRESRRETWLKLADYYDVPVSYLMGLPDGLVQHINKTQSMTTDEYTKGQNDMLALIKNIYYTSNRKEFEEFLGADDLDDNEVMRFLQERYMRLGKKQLIKSIVKEFNL